MRAMALHLSMVFSIAFAMVVSTAFALPASNADIRDCVSQSRSDGSNISAIAQQCSGVQDVQMLRTCVDEVRKSDGLNMPETAAVCSGVRNVKTLRECIAQERRDGFNNEELTVLCNQK